MKNKFIKQKQRYRRIDFNTTISVDKKTTFNFIPMLEGYVKAIDEDENEYILNPYEITEYFNKDNGKEKILSTSIIDKKKKSLDVDNNLLAYDYILVIDTSYEIINTVNKAFTAYSVIEISSLKVINGELSGPFEVYTVEWDATGIDKPENLMYADRINVLNMHFMNNNVSCKVAVIVDSDLGNIQYFNNRKLPIFNDYILPDNFYIFYASSDSGNCIQNILLKACDNEAKKALNRFKNK